MKLQPAAGKSRPSTQLLVGYCKFLETYKKWLVIGGGAQVFNINGMSINLDLGQLRVPVYGTQLMERCEWF